jgi:hypothetical protein
LLIPKRALDFRSIAPQRPAMKPQRGTLGGAFATSVRDNALTLAIFGLFLGSLLGQAMTGHAVHDSEAMQHGGAATSFTQYLTTGHFVEAVFENWESEFLQIAVFVVLTKYLRQKGSSESKSTNPEAVDEDPRAHRLDPGAPWPVRRGGLVLVLYERSLSIALITLFFASFALHAAGGARTYSEQERQHGGQPVSAGQYVLTSQFWFESFQNWQSEFLSVGALIVLSIFLRERGSPQSKPVAAPHAETGE